MTFLKWVGGKTQLLSALGDLFPDMSGIDGYIDEAIVLNYDTRSKQRTIDDLFME